MKRQYLQNLPKPTEFKNEAYNAYYTSVQKLFESVSASYDRQTCQYLLEQITKMKDIKQLKRAHRKPIYQFFLKRQLQTLSHIKGLYSIDYEIMKITKCKVQDFKISWKDLWEKILKEVSETGVSASKWIQNFIKHVKVFFDQNNALQVWEYFYLHNYKDLAKMVHLFTKISPKTNANIFNQFIMTLIKNTKIQKIANYQFLVLFQWLLKSRKQITLQKQVFQFVNNLVLQYILANTEKSSKKTIENNFNAGSAELLERVLGKANPGSVKILQIVFSFLKKFIKPLQNSTRSVVFIYWFLKSIFQRVQIQKKTKQRLEKLIEKLQKKKADQEQENQPKLQVKQSQKEPNEKQGKQKKQDEQNDDQQEDEQAEEEDQEDQQIQQLLMNKQDSKIAFQKDQDTNDKDYPEQEQIERMQKLFSNQLTSQILSQIEKQIQQIFQVLYYVNSKKTISHLLRYIYRLFPKFVIKSLDTLDKAASIPSISQDGLVKNLTVTVEHMFMQENYKEGIKNIMRVLEKAYNSRRIVDVWYIYQAIQSKIPILDQKDIEAIPEEDKKKFEQTFQMNHDRFYQQYSDHIAQAFKRLIRQGEYLEKGQHKPFNITMQQMYHNSYQHMKKRILSQVMQVIAEKPNPLALFYLAFCQMPQREYEVLKNNFVSMNEENRDTEEIRLQILGVLSRGMTLQQIKPYIRKMAEKGHFRLIEDYAVYRSIQSIKWEPYKTTLDYLQSDPKIKIQFENPLQKRKLCLKQLQEYRDQLINQAIKEMDQIKQDEPDSIPQRIAKSYTNTVKIQTFAHRKKLYEILSIVSVVNFMMEQKLIQVKNSKKLQLVDSGVKPYGFLDVSKPFSKYIKKILNSQQVLHDPKLISILNTLLTDEFFMYFDIEMKQDKKLTKQKKKNKNHEAPDHVNRITYGNQYISLARSYMALLLDKTNGGVNYDIKGKIGQLFILCMINSNQSYKDIRSMFQQSKMIPQFKSQLTNLMKLKTENRDLIKRISSTIDFITKKQNLISPFTNEQILEFVSYHTTLIQSNDSKVKQNAIKSFKKFANIIYENKIDEDLTKAMLKYRNTEKMEIFWIIYVAALIHHVDFQKQKEKTQKLVLFLIENMQPLVLHQSRSIRRTSLYLYPYLVRILKKIHAQHKDIPFQPQNFKQKDLIEFIQTGFLRPQFYDTDLKDKTMHRKHPFATYQVKTPYPIPSHIFSFLIDNPEKAVKFVKTYHSDLASTTEQMISAMHSAMSTVDLFAIANKALQKVIYFFKTRDMGLSRGELLVGSKFFKYLCVEDAGKGYKFFKAVKQFILECLTNMQSLDNHNMVILYAYSLINAYQTTFKERIPQIQQFLTKIFKQIIKKSSKAIYTKLQTLFFKKIKNRQAVKFIEQMCQKMIEQGNRIFRTGYLLATINGKAYRTSQRLLKKMMDEKLQLEHQSNITNTLNFLLTYPQNEKWDSKDIQKTKIIDLEKLKQQKKAKELFHSFIIFPNKQFLSYLISTLTQMLSGDSLQMIKTSFSILNNLIKCCADLIMTEENSDFVVSLLQLWLKMLKEKKELQLDFQSGNKAISYLLGSSLLPAQVFENFLLTILQNVQPSKKSCDVLNQMLNSPINFIGISTQLFIKFIKKLLDFESNSQIYKQLLIILSTLLRYRTQPFENINAIQVNNKNRRALLLQAYLLAENVELKPQLVKEVLKISTKDRKNIWAREMKLIRGQRQFFDKQQTYDIWREIKQLSNTYNYHA